MALNNTPPIIVSAKPVNTYVAPGTTSTAGLELYDEQQVRLALEFSDAFSNLSVSAARLAGNLKEDWNKEDFEAGKDLVRQNQKTYIDLIKEGKIKPSENPWLALGAQEASGIMEGQKARVEFQQLYNKQALENPEFFKDRNAFDALASSFVANKEATFRDSVFLSRGFHETFDSAIPQLGLAHENEVTKRRFDLVVGGVEAKVLELVQNLEEPTLDFASWENTPPLLRKPLQNLIDEHELKVQNNTNDRISDFVEWTRDGSEAVLGSGILNQTIVSSIIELRKQGEYSKEAEYLMNNLKLGSGLLFDTQEAKAAVAQEWGAIKAGDEKHTKAKQQEFDRLLPELQREIRENPNTPQARESAMQTLEATIRRLPVNLATEAALRADGQKAIAQALQQKTEELVQLTTDTLSDAATRVFYNESMTPDQAASEEVNYVNALKDTVYLELNQHGLIPASREELFKITAAAADKLQANIKDAKDSGPLHRATREFSSLGGYGILQELDKPISSIGDLGRVLSTEPMFDSLKSIVDQSAVLAELDPVRQQEVKKNLYAPIKAGARARIKELRGLIDQGNIRTGTAEWGMASRIAEQYYSMLAVSAINTGNGTDLYSLVTEVENYSRNFNASTGTDPVISGLVNVLSNLNNRDIEQTKSSSQNYDYTLRAINLIRTAKSSNFSERDIIMAVQGDLQRAGANVYTNATKTVFSLENREAFKQLTYQKLKDVNKDLIDRHVDMFLHMTSQWGYEVWDQSVDEWVDNAMDEWNKEFTLINGGYVKTSELTSAFVMRDAQTNKAIFPSAAEAKSFVELVFKYHPQFKGLKKLSLAVELYPENNFGDTPEGQTKYQVITSEGLPVLDKPITLQEFQGLYFDSTQRVEFIRMSTMELGGFGEFYRNVTWPAIPLYTPPSPRE